MRCAAPAVALACFLCAPVARADEGDAARLRCPTSGDVLSGDEVTLTCLTPDWFRPAEVHLFYKPIGAQVFDEVAMQPDDSQPGHVSWTARIPGTHTRGDWLPFYFQAQDERGAPLANSGHDGNPHMIRTGGVTAPVQRVDRNEEDENPLLGARARSDMDEESFQRWFVGLAVGSGFGFASGADLETYQPYAREFSAGFAGPGLGHALPEVGFMVREDFGLSIVGRIQRFPRPNPDADNGAIAVLARARFFSGTGPMRFHASLLAGGGEGFRLVVDASTPATGTLRDTVRGGPVVVGAGGGLTYDLGGTFSWIAESELLAGFPDFSLAMDFNTGLRVRF